MLMVFSVCVLPKKNIFFFCRTIAKQYAGHWLFHRRLHSANCCCERNERQMRFKLNFIHEMELIRTALSTLRQIPQTNDDKSNETTDLL